MESFDTIVFINGHGMLTGSELSNHETTSMTQTTIFLAEFGSCGIVSTKFMENHVETVMRDAFNLTPEEICARNIELMNSMPDVKDVKEYDSILKKGNCSIPTTKYHNRVWQFNPGTAEGILVLCKNSEIVPMILGYNSPEKQYFTKMELMESLERLGRKRVLIIDASCLTLSKTDPPSVRQLLGMLESREWRKRRTLKSKNKKKKSKKFLPSS